MNTVQDLINKLTLIEEITNDIAENFGGEISLSLHVEENKYGGNPEYIVDMTGNGKNYPLKDKTFIYKPALQTFESFINEIKAYMLDVLDCLNNL